MSKISELAAKCLKAANGDVLVATASMHQRITRNSKLYHELMNPLVRNACYDQVRAISKGDRSVVWDNKPVSVSEDRRRITALADTYTLRDFPLPGGKRLGDATGEEIREAGLKYIAQGTDELHKGYWLISVADALPSPTARCTLSVARLEQLKSAAECNINRRLGDPPQAMAAE